MKDLEDRVFLFQNPFHFMRALKKKNYEMTQLIEQTRILFFSRGSPLWYKYSIALTHIPYTAIT